MKIALHGYLPEELGELCAGMGQPAFRAKQLWHWLQVRGATRWEDMGNLPKALKEALSATHTPSALRVVEESVDATGTTKWLFALEDGESIETVLIPARHWTTICLSAQVGCKMGCVFCASGKAGFFRQLGAGEIVAQFVKVAELTGRRPDNLVFMGMGEPLDNVEEVLKAVRLLNHPDGLQVGARRITISTSGIIPGIRRLAEEGLQLELSVSLHAPNHALRKKLMPVENKYPFDELIAACKDYTARTKRFVTFEYTLIRGVNDSPEQAHELADTLRRFSCRVNLIPLSPVDEYEGGTPERRRILAFQEALAKRGVSVTLRESKGSGVNAACGQLRRRRVNRELGEA